MDTLITALYQVKRNDGKYAVTYSFNCDTLTVVEVSSIECAYNETGELQKSYFTTIEQPGQFFKNKEKLPKSPVKKHGKVIKYE